MTESDSASVGFGFIIPLVNQSRSAWIWCFVKSHKVVAIFSTNEFNEEPHWMTTGCTVKECLPSRTVGMVNLFEAFMLSCSKCCAAPVKAKVSIPPFLEAHLIGQSSQACLLRQRLQQSYKLIPLEKTCFPQCFFKCLNGKTILSLEPTSRMIPFLKGFLIQNPSESPENHLGNSPPVESWGI